MIYIYIEKPHHNIDIYDAVDMTNDYTEVWADWAERREGIEKIIWETGREGPNRRGNLSNENERVQ